MSGVYARNRKETYFEPVDNAAALQDAVTKYIMDEKRVPKRWRLILGIDLVEKVDEIADLAIAANETWPDEKHIEKRRDYWRDCLKACKQLDRKFARLQNCVPSATAGSMGEILKLLDKEIGTVTHHKDHDKIIPSSGGHKKKF